MPAMEVHKKPQDIFLLSTCGIFHALPMAAALFTVQPARPHDNLPVNLTHDVIDLGHAEAEGG